MPTPFALLLEARTLASPDYHQPLTKDLVLNINAVHLDLMHAFSSRVAFAFGREHRLRHLEVNYSGRQWCLVHISCRLPTLLERLDKCVALIPQPEVGGELAMRCRCG